MTYARLLLLTLPIILLTAGCGKSDHDHAADAGHDHEETSRSIVISMQAQRESAIITATVGRRPIATALTVPGRIEYDQQRVAHLTSRVAGRVEQVLALLGDRVKAGQVLATIYSQEYLTTQAEFIQAQRRFALAASHSDSTERRDSRLLLESVRRRLAVLGASDEDIAELARTLSPSTLLKVRSTISGTVTETSEILGHAVEIGTLLFHIADLSRVWVGVDINEKDVALPAIGGTATFDVAAWPGERFSGRLTRIFDVVDEKTRTIQARVEAVNDGQKLKPGMFVTVALATQGRVSVLAAPVAAVQRDGDERFVFVATSDTTFEKRHVETGQEAGDWIEIRGGVQEGERIVTDGAFTVKSEFLKGTIVEEHDHD